MVQQQFFFFFYILSVNPSVNVLIWIYTTIISMEISLVNLNQKYQDNPQLSPAFPLIFNTLSQSLSQSLLSLFIQIQWTMIPLIFFGSWCSLTFFDGDVLSLLTIFQNMSLSLLVFCSEIRGIKVLNYYFSMKYIQME